MTSSEHESWGDLVRSYRKTYGTQALVASAGPVEHYNRTKLTQLDVNSKRLFDVGADYTREKPTTMEAERHARHGRGLTLFTMSDEDARRRGELTLTRRNTTASLADASTSARTGAGVGTRMFGILSMGNDQGPSIYQPVSATTRGSAPEVIDAPGRSLPASAPSGSQPAPRSIRDNGDSWIGHFLIDPAHGKRPAKPPTDPRGRRDLFQVLNQAAPGKPADDSWLGHRLIDPSRGKAHPPGPEQRMGRKDLFPVIQQQALDAERVGGAVRREPDPLGDSWIGHAQIDPRKGKAWVQSGQNKLTHVQDMVNRWDDRPNNQVVASEFGPIGKVRTTKCAPGPVACTVPEVLAHQGPFQDDIGPRIRKQVAGPRTKEFDEIVNRKRTLRGPVGLSNIKSKDYEILGRKGGKVLLTKKFDGTFSNSVL